MYYKLKIVFVSFTFGKKQKNKKLQNLLLENVSVGCAPFPREGSVPVLAHLGLRGAHQ